MKYVETDCTFEFEGQKFEALGAYVTDQHIVAYLGHSEDAVERVGSEGTLVDWKGRTLGTYTITHSWETPRSAFSYNLFQVEAIVNHVVYTGRSCGFGMIYRGRRKAGQ